MERRLQHGLSKRERQIIDAIYKRKKATVREVLSDIPDPPSYSAVRTMMNILVTKGLLKRKKTGKRYQYIPTISQQRAVRSALQNLLNTYFDNSLEQAVTALLEVNSKNISDEELERLSKIIENAKKEEDSET